MILTEGLAVDDGPKSPELLTSPSTSTLMSEAQTIYDSPPPYYGSTSDAAAYTRRPASDDDPPSFRWRVFAYQLARVVNLLGFSAFLMMYFWEKRKNGDKHWNPGPITHYPIPETISLHNCTSVDGWMNVIKRRHWDPPYSAETTFELPLNNNKLLFLSTGALSAGVLHLLVDPIMRGDTAIVRLYVSYTYKWARDLSRVCRIARIDDDHEIGVGIFSPQLLSPPPPNAQLSFNILVYLPRSHSQRIIKGLNADLYRSSLRVGDLSMYQFDAMSFQTTDGAVDVETLCATDAAITTSNARISGQFNISNSFIVNASNSDLLVDIGVTSTSSTPSNVNLYTSERPLQANFSLTSTSAIGGAFNINVTASNNTHKVQFPAQPLDSKLNFTSSMTSSRATFVLNTAYEGTFDILGNDPTIWFDPTADDPGGKHRTRTLKYTSSHTRIGLTGSTVWEEGHEGFGQVRVLSTDDSKVEVDFNYLGGS